MGSSLKIILFHPALHGAPAESQLRSRFTDMPLVAEQRILDGLFFQLFHAGGEIGCLPAAFGRVGCQAITPFQDLPG